MDGKKFLKVNIMLVKRVIMKKNFKNCIVIIKVVKCDGLNYRILIVFRWNDGCRFIISCIVLFSLFF